MIEPLISAFFALIAAFCWGINSHIVRVGIKDENVFLGFFYRASFTFPILLLISFFISQPNILQVYFSFNEITLYIMISVILILIGDGFFMLALKEFPVNVIMPIAAIYPLITTVILIITGTENISHLVLFGTLFIIVGVSIVTRYGNNNGKNPVSRKAIKFALISAFSWGTSVVFVTLILKNPGADPISLTGFRTLFMGIFAIGIYIFLINNNKKVKRPKNEKIKSLSFMALSGVVGWVFGASIFFIAVQNIGW